jgi:3-oxoacyl-(acyl-carrier-protein) synthase/NAD(P)-dependent dehydrogenase (short-subunit alcohol dehydrogenase family)/acyl-CoA thioesterase FadM
VRSKNDDLDKFKASHEFLRYGDSKMSYISVPYQLLFEDTMAYGTHHYLSNFRFQCIAREHFFFGGLFDKETFKDVVMLTQQGYSRNMAPVSLGERVAILMTFDEPSRSTARLCFRVIRNDGTPVCCGYQVLVFTSTAGEVIPIPSILTNYVMQNLNLLERIAEPTFSERVVKGGKYLNGIFTQEVCEIAKVASGDRASNSLGFEILGNVHESLSVTEGKLLGEPGRSLYTESSSKVSEEDIVFVLPGQGSYDGNILSDVYEISPEIRQSYFRQADAVTQQYFNYSISSLAQAKSTDEREFLLQQCPELDQVGIFILDVVIADLLIKRGICPDVVVGHSFGEIAALNVGRIVDYTTGLEIVCKRVQALRKLGDNIGGMLAVTCPIDKLPQLASAIQKSNLVVAVVNHPSQIVLSGDKQSLNQIETELASLGISCKFLKSRYPFHSHLLKPAISDFASSLKSLKFNIPQIPVYSPIEEAFLGAETDFVYTIASQLIRPLNFCKTVKLLTQDHCPSFIECGAGNILTRIIQKNFASNQYERVWSTVTANLNLERGLENIVLEHSYRNLKAQANNFDKSDIAINATTSKSISPELNNLVSSSKNYFDNVPIAVISMGCLLPGAVDPEVYWKNVLSGVSGIVDLGDLDPSLVLDFKCNDGFAPDKTYTLLSGRVPSVNYEDSLPYSFEEFDQLIRGQKLLAKALNQCLGSIPIDNYDPNRVQCLLGSTADGIEEYDEALFVESLRYYIDQLDEPKALKEAFSKSIEKCFGTQDRGYKSLSPYNSYKPVIERLLGVSTELVLLDAACASSLYTVDIGVKLLRSQQKDLVLSGGVFAPSVGMNCLFAQFNGLSANGSHSFDQSADGVIFTEGAAVLALKRLPDALRDGDHICSVIRSLGTSSDGKSSAANVPTVAGQSLACQRAYTSAEISLESIQYVEAHATATPVGDATEYKSLCEAFSRRSSSANLISLGSVKSLIGHTGWAAGAASLIKVSKALESSVIPAQWNYQSPNKEIDLEAFPFEIPQQSKSWPKNIDNQPRRASVNAFGFGGTNANVILESYEPAYHSQISQSKQKHDAVQEKKPIPLVIVGTSTFFPSYDGTQGFPDPDFRRFHKSALHLPIKKRLLPDVMEDMDASQYLCVMGAKQALENINAETIASLKDRIGFVLGMPDKTGRGILANERIYLDRFKRILSERRAEFSLSDQDFIRIFNQLILDIETKNQPSTGYTLTGSMPNIAAGRVCNLLDFKGPNIVIDADVNSLLESIRTAKLMLENGNDVDLLLVGGVNAHAMRSSESDNDCPIGEALCILAITSLELAQTKNIPILAHLDLVSEPIDKQDEVLLAGSASQLNFRGATGGKEIAHALEQLHQNRKPVFVHWSRSNLNQSTLKFTHPVNETLSKTQQLERNYSETESTSSWDNTIKSLQHNPIEFFTPLLLTEEISQSENPLYGLEHRKILFLCDQPSWWAKVHSEKVFEDLKYTIVCPANCPISEATPVDLSTEEALRATMSSLALDSYDTLVVLKNLAEFNSEQLLSVDQTDPLLNLLFAVARQSYSELQSGKMKLVTVCLNANQQVLNPYTGLFSGFVKSLARELPNAVCKAVNTDSDSLVQALSQANVELNQEPGKPVEICYIKGQRLVFKLQPLECITKDRTPFLNKQSVVLATGGARGVTAVLMEEILRRFECKVILLGRTNIDQVPEHILKMTEASFIQYEREYYTEELAKNPSQKMPVLKRQYEFFEAARELAQTLQHLSELPGQLEYTSIDVTDTDAVNRLVQQIFERDGQIDLVVHGAGIQLSKLLPKRKLHEFQNVLSTKLLGLKNLHNACAQHKGASKTAFHILTSAFSYIGNDGQPDYGAANEFMNRLALYITSSKDENNWSTLAWLGWAGIGMTRGSEYAVLSRERGLRAIEAHEGQYLFTQLMNGQAFSPINVLLTEGEKNYYQIDVVNTSETSSGFKLSLDSPSENINIKSRAHELSKNGNTQQQNLGLQMWNMGVEITPYLLDHLVNGVPTLPATFEQELAAQAALALCPTLQIVAIENTSFTKFVKFFDNQPIKELKSQASILSKKDDETLVHVKIMSDFTHKSGVILESNVHCEMDVRLSSNVKPIDSSYPIRHEFRGKKIQEPYMHPQSPVRLAGIFDCLSDLVVGEEFRRATFQFKNPEFLNQVSNFVTPAILIDAMLRLATSSTAGGSPPMVFVPQGWQRVRLSSSLNDCKIHELGQELFLIGSNSRMDGDELRCEWLQVVDTYGRVIVLMEQAIGLRKSDQPARAQTVLN